MLLLTGDNGLPKGYFTSRLSLGTYLSVCFSLLGGVGPFDLVAPLLSTVKADIGPSADIAWASFAIAWCLTSCCPWLAALAIYLGGVGSSSAETFWL